MGKSNQPEMGARPIRRTLEQYLEDPLAEILLKTKILKPTHFFITLKEEKISFIEKNLDKTSTKELAESPSS